MSDKQIDVSVVIPAWKAETFIARSISSALASRDLNVEVVVVDDASPDDTYGELQRLAATDRRIVVDRLPVNSGPSAARNRAIALSKGRFVAVLDADDTITPDRLAYLLSVAEKSGADIVVDNMLEVDEAGERIDDEPFLASEAFAEPRDIDLASWIRFNQPMKGGECLGYLKPVFRRATLTRLAARYDEALRNSEDYYLVAHLLAAGARMTYTPEPGYLYQRSAASTSHRLQLEQTQAWLDAETRFRTLFGNMLTPEERSAQNRRERGLLDVHQFVGALDAVKAKNAKAVFNNLAADLHASAFTLSTFAKIAMGKALRRKLV